MSIPTFDLLLGPEFSFPAGEALIAPMTGILEDSSILLSVDQEHDLVLSANRNEAWVEEAIPGRVARMVFNGRATEWWISQRNDEVPGAPERVEFAFDALHNQLADVGPIEDVREGGITWWQGGGTQMSPRNYINTFVLPHLERHGIDYYEIGTLEVNQRLDLSFDGSTPLELWIRLADETDTEWYLTRDESSRMYQLNLVGQIGQDFDAAFGQDAFNILTLTRERTREELRSVVRPVGGTFGSADRRADIGYNSWVVASMADDDIVLLRHDIATGQAFLGPIAEDGQFAEVSRDGVVVWEAAYLEANDGTRWRIVDTDATTQTVTVESGGGSSFAVNDDVSIVRDVYGTLLTELPSPSALEEFGRIVGPMENTEVRGERNWVRNPFATPWPGDTDWYTGFVDGTQNSTTIDMDGFPPSVFIPEGSFVYTSGPTNNPFISRFATVSDATVDGTGAVTLEFGVAFGVDDNDSVWVSAGLASPPTDWEWITGGTGDARHGVIRFTGEDAFTGSAIVASPYTELEPTIIIGGLTAGDRIAAGSTIIVDGELNGQRLVLDDAIADSDGEAEVIAVGRGISVAASTAVEIFQPLIVAEDRSSDVLGLLLAAVTTDDAYTRTPITEVRHVTGGERLIFAAEMDLYNAGFTIGVDSGDVSMMSVDSPRVQLWRLDVSPEEVVAEVRLIDQGANDVVVAVGDIWRTRVQGEWEVPEGETAELQLRILQYSLDAGIPVASQQIVSYVKSATLSLSEDPQVPPVDGWHGRPLWFQGQTTLMNRRRWGATYEVDFLDLGELVDDPGVIRPDLGAFIRIQTSSPAIFDLLRIQQIEWRYTQPENPRLTLDRRPDLLTTQTREIRKRTLFARMEALVTATVNVDGTDVESAPIEVGDTVIPEEEPPTVPGVPRAGAGAPMIDPDDDEPVPITPVQPGGPTTGPTPAPNREPK